MTQINPDNLNRLKHKQVENKAEIDRFLDTERFGFLAVTDENSQPFIIPLAYARIDDSIVIHGSTGAGVLSHIQATTKVCFNVTRINGLVLARSGFESSVHYESVNILGTCEKVEGEEKTRLLSQLTEKQFPGREKTLRPANPKELAATLMLKISMDYVVAKRSNGEPTDEGEDVNWPIWAGILPIEQQFGIPIPASNLDPQFAQLPSYLENWKV
ncbi:MAG: pyridoxamine 5'-phosphate oxidase family protein [Candidatus Nanopelagicales bacterium]